MRFIPHTERDIREMLETIGVQNVDQLFAAIPDNLQLGNKHLDLPAALSESEVISALRQIANAKSLIRKRFHHSLVQVHIGIIARLL